MVGQPSVEMPTMSCCMVQDSHPWCFQSYPKPKSFTAAAAATAGACGLASSLEAHETSLEQQALARARRVAWNLSLRPCARDLHELELDA